MTAARVVQFTLFWRAMLFFARECRAQGLNCWFSVVDCVGEAEVEACRALAERIGVPLRVRPMID